MAGAGKRGSGSARAAGAGGRAARGRAQGHLTRWEPRPEPGAARGDAELGRAGTHRPSGLRPRAPPGRNGCRGASSRSSAFRSACPLPGLASSRDADSAGPRKRPVLPPLSPSAASSRSLVSPPPRLSPKRRGRLLSSPSSQHGGGGGGGSCRNASGGHRELAPSPLGRRPRAPLEDTECVTTETTLELHGKCSPRVLARLRSHAPPSNSC